MKRIVFEVVLELEDRITTCVDDASENDNLEECINDNLEECIKDGFGYPDWLTVSAKVIRHETINKD